MKITIQKTMNVHDPMRAHDTDAGLDLYVPEGQTRLICSGTVYMIDLGIRVAIPDGYYGQLALRSSAGQKGLIIPNGVGIIDSGYHGNLKVALTVMADPVLVSAQDRVCQLIIHKLPAVEYESGTVDDDTDRGTAGFGSTGNGPTLREYPPRGSGDLTVGELMAQLQDAAFRYGNDTPVAVLAGGGIDYEQAARPTVVNTVKTGRAGGWDQYRADKGGTPTLVLS